MQLEGIHTALVTPFDDRGELDEQAVVRLVHAQVDAGVRGLVVAGGTGEGLALTDEEWARLLSVVVQAAAGRATVTAHVSALSTAAAVRNAERARTIGAEIAMLQAPYDVSLTDDEVALYFAAVAAVGLPVMAYNNVSTGISLSVDLIARLAEIEGVRYLKDSSSDAARMVEVQLGTPAEFQVLLGKDSFALFGFLSGARAAVLGSANAFPEACVRLHRLAVLVEDQSSARAAWRDIAPLMRFFEQESYVAAVKAATTLGGIPVGDPRSPTLPLPVAKRAELERLLAAAQQAPATA
ncbi:dihydrodipicolinate synthase family protein [uncultured Amnibacterium sp.]|uniref:dihydrodipicolinate synthase family protein n=1 Tax=uncultured Amnibacterium sp. TaxID=1631851 RepID=UPI0035CB34D2